MMRAIALDDEPPALDVLTHFCGKTTLADLQRTFYKTKDAAEYLQQNEIDLMFLDVNMPNMSGLEFCRQYLEGKMVIFTTAYSEHAVDGFNLKAIDYLLKPFTYQRFLQAVEKANEYQQLKGLQQKEEGQSLLLKANYGQVKIAADKILYIESLDDYIKIYQKDAQPLLIRMTMKNILDKLSEKDFVRVHRSFIVAMRYVEQVRNKTVFIGATEIPVSASFEEGFLRRLR